MNTIEKIVRQSPENIEAIVEAAGFEISDRQIDGRRGRVALSPSNDRVRVLVEHVIYDNRTETNVDALVKLVRKIIEEPNELCAGVSLALKKYVAGGAALTH